MAVPRCAHCNTALVAELMPIGGGDLICGACRRPCVIIPLPAMQEDNAPKAPPPPDPPAEGEASCFYDPGRRATTSCTHCGVLISDINSARWGAQTVCLKCLGHLCDQGKDRTFETKRTLWDNIALAVALLPFTMILWWIVFFSAPAALFLALWHWNSPRGIVPRGRSRLILTLLIALAQLTGITLFIIGLINS